jgi:hypothetical protein
MYSPSINLDANISNLDHLTQFQLNLSKWYNTTFHTLITGSEKSQQQELKGITITGPQTTNYHLPMPACTVSAKKEITSLLILQVR